MQAEEVHLYGHTDTKSLETPQVFLNSIFVLWAPMVIVLDNRLQCEPDIIFIILHTLIKI